MYMKLILTILLTSHVALATDFTEQDKRKHITASSGIAMITYLGFRHNGFTVVESAGLAALVSLSVGHLKESTDPFYDHEDMEANLLGTGVGILIPMTFEF